jgi:hypothetical protein
MKSGAVRDFGTALSNREGRAVGCALLVYIIPAYVNRTVIPQRS